MQQKQMKKFKRKKVNLAINREFQIWLLIRILGVVLVSSVVAVLILYLYSRQEISSTFYSAHIQLRRVSDLLLPVVLAGGAVSLVSGIVLSLFLPLKIAGPVFGIQKGLKRVEEGDLTARIFLRKKDILDDLADSVNQTTASVQGRVARLYDLQKELDQLANKLDDQDLKSVTAQHKEALSQLTI